MGAVMYECGCSISSSMFGDYAILDISLCDKHSHDSEMQELMRAAANRLRELCVSEKENGDG